MNTPKTQKIPEMTKGHFQFLAWVVRSMDNRLLRVHLAKKLAKELGKTNPKFQPTVFLAACQREGDNFISK